MRIRNLVLILIFLSLAAVPFRVQLARAQQPVPKAASKSASKPPAKSPPTANLAQLMRGILFPNSNVIFFAQNHDPATITSDPDPSMSPNPLTTVYGGWQAVENSSLALSEVADLLTVPGRLCSNGRPVPLQNADWQTFVQGLRDAGLASYKAAQKKDQDAVVAVTDQIAAACSDCHNVYREKTPAQGGMASRCIK